MEQQSAQLDQEMAMLLKQHQDAVQRLAEVPGLGIDSPHQIIAEVGPRRPHFLPTSISPPGSAHVLEMKRVREYHAIIVPQKGTPICAAFSINVPMLRSNSKAASFRSSTGGYRLAWDTIKP